LDNRYELLEKLLASELARRDYWLYLGLLRFDIPTLRGRVEATLSEVVCAELTTLCSMVPGDACKELAALVAHAATVLNAMGIESAITTCDALTAIPSATAESLSLWQGIAQLLLTDKGEWRARVDKNIGFPPEDKATKQRVVALLQRLQSERGLAAALHLTRQLPRAKYTDAQWLTLADLLEVLKLAIAELEVVMRERGEADYVANAIAARRALGTLTEPTDLALRLDYRLQHLLVDEFQDTSHGQVELLALLTAGWSEGDGRSLFCVGDPMQSIYRFRHADVGLFLNLKRHGLNQLHLTPLRLTVNFRAAQPLLAWTNQTFEQALPTRDEAQSGAVAFTPSEPHASADSTGGVFVHALLIDKEAGDRVAARREEAKQIGALIAASLVNKSDTKIAVLASNRMHLQWVIAELRSRGIAFQAVDIDPLAQRPVVADLVALTRAVVHLADRTAWLTVLRAPWCGLSLADLYALCAGDDAATQPLWQKLNDRQQVTRLSTDGRQRVARILPVVQVAVAERGRSNLRDCIERTWHALGGPATVTTAASLDDSSAFFARLEKVERNGDIEDIVRLEESLIDL
ncbi:MAG: UvrD-helicase domain-containing protein, partial [Candidatus Obscuribacterales bacterium]|nr:UvrD-helicase domain-containing protein [Steroidobacteraceae bacterium]